MKVEYNNLNVPRQKRYLGQTVRPFRVRVREHYNDYKYT